MAPNEWNFNFNSLIFIYIILYQRILFIITGVVISKEKINLEFKNLYFTLFMI